MNTLDTLVPAPHPDIADLNAVTEGDTIPVEVLRGGGCFSPDCLVQRLDADATAFVRADDIKAGDVVRTGSGKATIRCVTFTPCPRGKAEMIRIDALLVTPYHPIRSVHNEWIFPIDIGEKVVVSVPHVVNFVLDADHELVVDGVTCVTLGHGKLDSHVVQHPYWGRDVVDVLHKTAGWRDGRVRLDPPPQGNAPPTE